MKPHIWKSLVHMDKWACWTDELRGAVPYGPGRRLYPHPHAPVVYGDTPTEAYNNWKELQ
jgi:hypothetical protein